MFKHGATTRGMNYYNFVTQKSQSHLPHLTVCKQKQPQLQYIKCLINRK
uniref:Uncharacterized protein n=1 Tax=Arundo donax TaxID=35708 RepID=A0A0A9G377_ARUDO